MLSGAKVVRFERAEDDLGVGDAVVVLVIAVLYHLRYALDCQYNANNTQISEVTPQNAQLLTRCHLIGISKVACWGRECA